MLIEQDGAMDFTTEEIEELFRSTSSQEISPPATEETTPSETSPAEPEVKTSGSIEDTKAFAKRLREKSEQVRIEEREAIAKSLGYSSYAEMQKKREEELMQTKGLNPETVAPVVEQLVEERLKNDPRLKELDDFKKQKMLEFGKKELAEITKLTGGEVTELSQLPKEVIELWKQKGSLKSAFLAVKGEELLIKARSEHSKGSTSHLSTPSSGSSSTGGKRYLTAEEKATWKFFNPKMTDEELNKKMVDK